jgi:chaperonin GroEL
MVGAKIVQKALHEPAKILAQNAGYNGNVVLSYIKEKGYGYGFDGLKEEYVLMEENGIVDPLKVIRIALQNAASVAAMALITEALVTDIPEEKKTTAPMPQMPQY